MNDQQQLLSTEEKKLLLTLARQTLAAKLENIAEPLLEAAPPAISEPRACFVSLHLEGRLRGCIGSLKASEPLYRNVQTNAANAAFSDPRFHPLAPEEMEGIRIEISVLTPSRPIVSINEFEIGKHGIIFKKKDNRAIFLPQVAIQQGWDRKTTLNQLSRKAGLSADAWQHPEVDFWVFEAIVFSETEFIVNK